MKIAQLLVVLLLWTGCQPDRFSDSDENARERCTINFSADPQRTYSLSQSRTETALISTTEEIAVGDRWSVSVSVDPMPQNETHSRASLIDASTLTDFGVTGYYTQNSNFNQNATANYLVNEKVSKGTVGWSYTNTRFWPTEVNDRLSFFAYAPYINAESSYATSTQFSFGQGTPTVKYTTLREGTNNCDLMVASLIDQSRPTDGSALIFTMKHVLSSIGFTVTGNGEQFDEISLEGIYRTATLPMNVTSAITWKDFTNLSTATDAPKAKINGTITTSSIQQSVNTADGYIMAIPQTIPDAAELVIKLGTTEVKRIKLKKILTEWQPGKRYVYNLKFSDPNEIEVDLRAEESNCFLLNPAADANKNITYKLPIKQVNRFWGNASYGTPTPDNKIVNNESWQVALLWQDKQNMVRASGTNYITISKSTGTGIDDYFAIRIPKGATVKSGNFVVGITTNGTTPSLTSGNLLWSWHIWVTNYNPYAPGTQTASGTGKKTTVSGGSLYTYVNGSNVSGEANNANLTVWGNPYTYILDRNVGMLSASNVLTDTDGQFTYQFGRKDPFPNNVSLYNITGATVTYSIYANIKSIGLVTSVQYPLNFGAEYSNTGRWCSDYAGNAGLWHDPSVTTATGKSLFDPSPQKFRVPVNGTWSNVPNEYKSGTWDGNSGYYNAPYFYSVCRRRYSSTGDLNSGNVSVWSSTTRNNDGSGTAGAGGAYSFDITSGTPDSSGHSNAAKASSRAVRSVQ